MQWTVSVGEGGRAALARAGRRALLAAGVLLTALGTAQAGDYSERLPEDEILYFLLPDRFDNADPGNDRGGLTGDRLQTGFDPTADNFYHGGDLQGVIRHLDYIQGLGATALWLTPVFRNKPVQSMLGIKGTEAAAYHGYWITDFTSVDPHLGSDADLHALVDAAHARGMKVYLDIVVNHTADVIRYRECPQVHCPYRSKADYPYTRRGGLQGAPINEGFLGDDAVHQNAANFAHLTRPDYAYSPYVPAGEEHAKKPDWLNDPIYYHNRGESTFKDESSTYGDFVGLDDVMTEHPRVVQGFIDIYGAWIDNYGIDGYRIDTAKHVNPEFWQAFVPAMLARARARGISHFHIFGEVSSGTTEVGPLARHTRVDKLPAVLDFAVANALQAVASGWTGTQLLAQVYDDDADYEGGEAGARQLPTFISNHDGGRFAMQMLRRTPQMDSAQALQRTLLANAMLLTLRGVPVLYYGDEQGFVGSDGDNASRQDMFASQVPAFRSQMRLGGQHTPGGDSFDTGHPLYQAIAQLARLRSAQPALRRGRQVLRADSKEPGLLAISRFDPQSGRELVLAFNTATHPVRANIEVQGESAQFDALAGDCRAQATAPGSYEIALAPLSYAVCAARAAPTH